MECNTALLSVYDKIGIVEFAQALIGFGWRILSSGGTAQKLRDAGVPVQSVEELIAGSQRKVFTDAWKKAQTGKPQVIGQPPSERARSAEALFDVIFAEVGKPILGHRVVTLSREVHAAILARMIEEDRHELDRLGLPAIGLVCVDMYPLVDAINAPGATFESVTEMTDIGGPTLLYAAAAKGGQITIADARDRKLVLHWMSRGCPDRDRIIGLLAVKTRRVVRRYQQVGEKNHAAQLGVDSESIDSILETALAG